MTTALLLAALTETKLKVVSGEMRGAATVNKRLLEDGSKYVRLDLSLARPGGKAVNVVQESTYASDGTPVVLSQVVKPNGPSLTAVFGKSEVVLTTNGIEKHVALPDGSIRATPEFWVVRDHPKTGTKVTYRRLDLTSGKWMPTLCVYRGQTEAGGMRVHSVQLGDTRALLDDAGDPVRIESGPTVMSRS